MKLLTPAHWKDYELLDSGGFEKLERFGQYVLIRPEPQAVWDKNLNRENWLERADAIFQKDANNIEKGKWEHLKHINDPWFINYDYNNLEMRLKVSLSSFKHVGVFPEQATNWDFIFDTLQSMPVQQPKVLNLFAYTGAASVAAKAAGADVTHVDSIKPVISWARENMEASGFSDIRWMPEDALKFVNREVRRGNKYNGLILDPPAYGRGPAGEKWLLEEHINEMLKACAQLLDETHHFFIINLYSIGFSVLILDNLVQQTFGHRNGESGELYLEDPYQKRLPLGIYARFSS